MTPEELANQKAAEVLKYVSEQPNVPSNIHVKGDIILLIALAAFILQFIQFMRDKQRDSKQALAVMQNPGIIQKWQLRRMLKQHLKDKYKSLHYQVMNGLVHVAKDTSEPEIAKMYEYKQ